MVKDKREKIKTVLLILSLNLIFLFAVIYLTNSELTFFKLISFQHKIFVFFIANLKELDALFATIRTFSYLFFELLSLSIFLIILSFGFLLVFLLKERIGFKIFSVFQLIFFILAYLLTKSTFVLISYVGIIASNIFIIKLFESKTSEFYTVTSLISTTLKIMNFFLCFSGFITLYINFQNYENLVFQSYLSVLNVTFPDLIGLHSKLINQTADYLIKNIEEGYKETPSPAREQCKPLYDSIIEGIRRGKEEETKKSTDEEKLREVVFSFPFFEQTIKAYPLIFSLLSFAILEIIRQFLSLIFGIIFYFLIRIKKTI